VRSTGSGQRGQAVRCSRGLAAEWAGSGLPFRTSNGLTPLAAAAAPRWPQPRWPQPQFPGALYHVINRGKYRQDVFGMVGAA